MVLREFLVAGRRVADGSAAPPAVAVGRDAAALRFESQGDRGVVAGLMVVHWRRAALVGIAALFATVISTLLPLQFGVLTSAMSAGRETWPLAVLLGVLLVGDVVVRAMQSWCEDAFGLQLQHTLTLSVVRWISDSSPSRCRALGIDEVGVLSSVVPQMTQLVYVVDGLFTAITLSALVAITALQLGWLSLVLLGVCVPLFALAVWCVGAVGRLWGMVSRENQQRADEAAGLVVDLDLIARQDLADAVMRAVDRQRRRQLGVLVRRARLQAFTRSRDRHTTLVVLTVCALLLYLLGSSGEDAGAVAATLLAASLIVERSQNAIADYRVLRLVREVVPQLEALRNVARRRRGADDTPVRSDEVRGLEFVSRDEFDRLTTHSVERCQLVSRDQPLFAGSVRSNLCAPSGAEHRVAELAAMVELDVPLDRELIAGRSGVSEGQRARIVLVRALLQSPSLLLIDEALDTLPGPLARRIIARLSDLDMHVVVVSGRADLELDDLLVGSEPRPAPQIEPDGAATEHDGAVARRSVAATLWETAAALWPSPTRAAVIAMIVVASLGFVAALSMLDRVADASSLAPLTAIVAIVSLSWLACAAVVRRALGSAAERTHRYYQTVIGRLLRRPPMSRSALVANLTHDFEEFEISTPSWLVGLGFAVADTSALLGVTLMVQPAAVFVLIACVPLVWWSTRLAARWQGSAEASESDPRNNLLESTAVTASHAANRQPNLVAGAILSEVHTLAGRYADRLYWSRLLSWRATYFVRLVNTAAIATLVVLTSTGGRAASAGIALALIVSLQQIGGLASELQSSGRQASVLRRVLDLREAEYPRVGPVVSGSIVSDDHSHAFRQMTVRAAPTAPEVTITDFTVRVGDMVALIGPSGGGKSTMLYAVAETLRGSGRCCNLICSELPSIGHGNDYTPSVTPALAHLTSLDSPVGDIDGAAAQAINLSRVAGLGLSDVALLDEATARLTADAERAFLNELRGCTTVFAALHRRDNLDLFDKVLICEGGTIREP